METVLGYINVNRINQAGNFVTVLGTHQVDNQADDVLLTNVTAGSMVRIQVDEDAFHAGTPEVSLKFHDGTDSTGDVIARVVVEIEDKPSTPQTGSAVVDGFADTVGLAWTAGRKGNAQPHHYEVSITTGSGFSDSNVTGTSLTIQNARAATGIGIHTAEVRHCNEAGGCSDALEIPLRVPYSFTPHSQDPLELGEGSPIWTAPSDVTDVFVDVEFSPGTVTETVPGDIEIHLLDSSYLSLGAYVVDHADDDGALEVLDSRNVQHTASGGSSVRINAGKDAFASAAEMKIKLHSGNDATGDQIAVATVKTQTRPATPVNGRSYEQPASNAVVLEWYPGTTPAGASAHHYEVVIPDAAATDPDLYANLNVPQLAAPTQTVTLTIQDARTDPGVGTHTAQVRHCNPAGGCSEPLTIRLTVSPQVEITISDLADTTELGTSDPFTVTISNLISSVTYNITVTADNANAGFDAGCPDLSKNAPAYTGGTSHSAPFTLYTCWVGEVSVTATVTAGANTWTTSADVTIAVPTILSPPTNLQISVNPDENQQMDVTYDLPVYPVHFQFEISRNPIETRSYTAVPPQVDHASPAEFTNMDIGYWYQVRASNCKTYTAPTDSSPAPIWEDCGPWSDYSSPYLLRLFAPKNLEVEPLPYRQAKLTWMQVDHASGYEVGLEDSMGEFVAGGNWHHDPTDPDNDDGKASTNSIIINLDKILVDNTSYDFQVRAIHDTSSNPDLDTIPGGIGEPSPAVTIIDNPVLQDMGSANGNSPTGAGQALLKWKAIPDVAEYVVKYRKLGNSPGTTVPVPSGNHHHSNPAWPNDDSWPYYGDTHEDPPFSPAPGAVSKTISGLTTGEIYAFQVNYVTSSSKKVLSARDAYVYPSQGFPGQGLDPERVATFRLFGRWEDKEYVYSVCEDTFPATTKTVWNKLIVHAFEQWESSTSMVTMTPTGETASPMDCLADSNFPFSTVQSIHNEVNEVFMVDTGSVQLHAALGYEIFTRNMLSSPLFACIYKAPACTLSPEYLGNLEASTELTNDSDSVDILINKNHEDVVDENLEIPGSDNEPSTGDVKFNTCTPQSIDKKPFAAYRLMLHESGHALGVSGFSLAALLMGPRAIYEMAHPTIFDSVMNYNKELRNNVNIYGQVIMDEPDCSPHPFDIMAIYALYQTVR